MANSTYCPECDGKITLNPHASLGQKLSCPHCDADLEVISLEPLELDWAYDWSWDDEDEDYDDDEEDEDDWDD
jgi:lysine biosynthesis protein LysW